MIEWKHCDFCSYENDNGNIKFHKIEPRKYMKRDEGQESLDMCDFCYHNTGAERERYCSNSLSALTFQEFAQGMNWLSEQIKELK